MLPGLGLRMKISITDERGIAVDHTASAEQCSLATMYNWILKCWHQGNARQLFKYNLNKVHDPLLSDFENFILVTILRYEIPKKLQYSISSQKEHNFTDNT